MGHHHCCRLLAALLLLVLSGGAAANDIVRLKNGKEVVGKVIDMTATVVTVQLETGVLKIRRDRVEVIRKEPEIKPPALPIPADGKTPATEAEVPDKGPGTAEKEGGKEPAAKRTQPPEKGPAGEEGAEKPAAGEEEGGEQPEEGAAPVPEKEEGTDQTVLALLERFLFLPKNQGNRIGVGVGLFFIIAMMAHISAKLADLEDLTVPRSLAFTMLIVCLGLVQLALIRTFSIPIVAGCLAFDLLAWFTGTRLIFKEGFWKSTIMLCFFLLALLVGVLWIEIAHFILDM